jgi:hypothetical protein
MATNRPIPLPTEMADPPDVGAKLLQSCTTDREYRMLLTLGVLVAFLIHVITVGCCKRKWSPRPADDMCVTSRNKLAARLGEKRR